MELGEFKGAALDAWIRWHAKRKGLPALEKVLSSLDEELKRELRVDGGKAKILPSSWYTKRAVFALCDAFVPKADHRSEEIALDAARFTLTTTLSGIYRTLFAMMATPERWARHANSMWRRHYRSGEMTITLDSEFTSTTEVSGWEGHHPFICRINQMSATPLYELMGHRVVESSTIACVGRGASSCRYLVRWAKGSA